ELEPSGQDVAVLLPPVRGAGRAGQGQQLLAFGLVGDPVQAEQVGHVARPGGAAPPLQAADLGVSSAYRLGGLRGGEVAGFPQPPQLRAQRDPQHGRPATRAGERADAKCAGKRAGGLALALLTPDHRRSLRPRLAVPNVPSVAPSGPPVPPESGQPPEQWPAGGGTSRVGFRSKNPVGLSTKPQRATGMTGQCSGRGTWVGPNVCHTTMSAPSMSWSPAMKAGRPAPPGF